MWGGFCCFIYCRWWNHYFFSIKLINYEHVDQEEDLIKYYLMQIHTYVRTYREKTLNSVLLCFICTCVGSVFLIYMWLSSDKRAAEHLSQQVNEACLLLSEYNQRLASELEERKKVAFLLRGFVNQVKAQMQDTEKQLDVSFWPRTETVAHLHRYAYIYMYLDGQMNKTQLHIFTLLHSVTISNSPICQW